VDSVVYGCTDGSEVRWVAGRLDASWLANPCTGWPTVGQLATVVKYQIMTLVKE